ncbi:MAG: hydroxyacid dehydrogenase [Burkholderiales bacterium]|nr:hydroxyacid dehydrogenase [Burkholderiales bacterium]
MSTSRKNVVRFDLPVNPAFDQRLARESDIDLTVCRQADAEEVSWAALARAHVYHVSTAKDELARRWFVNDELIARCPALLCVSSSGAGYDTVDVAACTRAGVVVMNQAGGNANSVAEHAFGMIIALSRRIIECDRRLRHETGFTREEMMGHEIGGKILGIVGIGHVGTRVAALAHAFGMSVLATDPYLTEEEIGRRGATSVTLDDLLAQSDIVSLHCPRAKDTIGMIDARALQRMKSGAMFITTARGGIHDEAALLAALESGHISGAGLDVWDQEPPPLTHPLLKLGNVIASFHTAGVTHEARRNMAAIAAEQIAGAIKGGRPPRLINPEVWPAYAARFESLLGVQVQVLDSE